MEDNSIFSLQEVGWERGLDSSGSGKGQIAGFCVKGN